MKYLFLILSCTLFSQELISTFTHNSDDISFIASVADDNRNHYLLTYDKRGKEEILFWKSFDNKYVDSNREYPLQVNDTTFFEYFPESTIFLIQAGNSSIKQVHFVSEHKRVFTFYTGWLDTNQIEKGFYDVQKKYDVDYSDVRRSSIRLLKSDNHFILMFSNRKKYFTYFKFTEENKPMDRLFVPGDYYFKAENVFLTAATIDENFSSKYFPDSKAIFVEEDAITFIHPQTSGANHGFLTKAPLYVIHLDVNTRITTLQKIDFDKSGTLDYALVDGQLFIACEMKEGLGLYKYDIKKDELSEIHTLREQDKFKYDFIERSYYLNDERNEEQETSFDKWYKELKRQTLVLDVDKLNDGNYELTISGARYRDPNGFAKFMGSVMIGSLTGAMLPIGIAPIFGASNLQPLMISVALTYNVETGTITPHNSAYRKSDIFDKLVEHNANFNSKTLVAELDKELLIYKDNSRDLYYVIDFSKLKED